MRVVIDISPLRGKYAYRGISVYTRLLVEALRKASPKDEFIMTSKKDLVDAEVIHYPYFDLFIATLPLIKRSPTVVTIHDLIPLVYAEHYQPGIRGCLSYWRQKISLAGVKAVITDSEKSKLDIQTYLKIPENKIHRIYLAAGQEFKPLRADLVAKIRREYNLNRPYFLYVGDINYNKNLPALIKAFVKVDSSFDLVLVTRALKEAIPEAKEIIRLIDQFGLAERIKILTSIPKSGSALAGIYSGAKWYIQPSLYEGFGFTVLEAMQCGTPVICSDGGSLPEITGETVIQFKAGNESLVGEGISKALVMTSRQRGSLIKKGFDQARRFTWEKTAGETLEVYRSVCKK